MIKFLIFLILVVGLLAPTTIAVCNIVSHVIVYRATSPTENGYPKLIASRTFSIGGRSVSLNASLWPSVVVVGATMVLLLGTFFLFRIK